MLHFWENFRQKNSLLRFLLPELETQFSSLLITSCRILFLALFPALLFFILGNFITITRAVFVLDYFLLALLTPWLHRYILALLFSTLIFLDIVFSVAPGYHFTFNSLRESLASIPYLDISSLIGYVLIFAVTVSLIIWITTKIVGTKRHKIGANILVLVLAYSAFIADANLSPNNARRDVLAATQTNIASSLLQTLKTHFFFFTKGNKKPSAYEVPSASKYLLDTISKGGHLSPRIVFVVVESFSLFQEAKINQLQFAALENPTLAQKYKIVQGSVPFNGSTVPAELRELCRVNVSAVIPDISLLPVEQCLPRKLKEIGYDSISVHGFSGFFFNRFTWYPEIGFEKSLFMPDIDKKLGADERCGSTFRGNCDHMILDVIEEEIKDPANPKLFLYWLTVNGHLPISDTEKIPNKADCSEIETLRSSPALCGSVKIGDSVIRGLVNIALDNTLPETLFIIVGDHMAPYLNNELRATMSDTLVPYAVLIPKARN